METEALPIDIESLKEEERDIDFTPLDTIISSVLSSSSLTLSWPCSPRVTENDH